MKKTKFIIIGSGITGVVIARNLAEAGFKVEIYEKRNHIAGNMYDYKKDGILIHKYGPHIFHTSDEEVNEYMNKFWKLNSFQNIVEGYVNNKLVPIPCNFKSIDILFPDKAKEIKNTLKTFFPNQPNVPILELKKINNDLLKEFSNFIYKNLLFCAFLFFFFR